MAGVTFYIGVQQYGHTGPTTPATGSQDTLEISLVPLVGLNFQLYFILHYEIDSTKLYGQEEKVYQNSHWEQSRLCEHQQPKDE